MQHNPYTPPEAEVNDPVRHLPPRPPQVRNACRLVLVSMVLGLVTLLPGVRAQAPDEPDVPLSVILVLVALFGGLTIWLVAKTHAGRNWARWGLLAYLMFGWWIIGSDITEQFLSSPLAGLIDAVCIAMEAVAMWLLFFSKGASWFRASQ